MKKFITMIVKWFISLFKKEVKPVTRTYETVPTLINRIKSAPHIGIRSYPSHNNRKMTNGRNIQYVYAEGSSKPIYHAGK